jgi:hypothetical protein
MTILHSSFLHWNEKESMKMATPGGLRLK